MTRNLGKMLAAGLARTRHLSRRRSVPASEHRSRPPSSPAQPTAAGAGAGAGAGAAAGLCCRRVVR
jgi:hypothetical protein